LGILRIGRKKREKVENNTVHKQMNRKRMRKRKRTYGERQNIIILLSR
jgi:hypothetical protein